MGMFDFLKDAGSKIGLGESEAEKAEREAAAKAKEAAADAKEAAEKAALKAKHKLAARQRVADAKAKRDAAAAAKAAEARAAKLAAQQERKAEIAKSEELEDFVEGLGLSAEDLDVRFDDGVAYVEGTVASQEEREKIILAIGNVSGVEKVDEEIDVVEPAPEAKMYTVVKGDTLSKIAKEFYGDASKYPVIFEANKPMLKDPNLIYPGQVLRIPEA